MSKTRLPCNDISLPQLVSDPQLHHPPRAHLPDTTPPPPPPIRPFLGLHAKLSQAFASYTVVFLIISAYQLFRTRDSVDTFTANAKQALANDCYALERTVTTLASFPHFAAQGVNHGLVIALNMAVSQIGYGLEVALSGFVSALQFIIGLLTGTWRCFLLNLASSGIPILSDIGSDGIQAIDDINNALVSLLTTPVYDVERVIQEKMSDPQIGLAVNVPVTPVQKVAFCGKTLNLTVVDRLEADFKQWILYATLALLGIAMIGTLGKMVWIVIQHKRWKVHVSRVMRQLAVMTLPMVAHPSAEPATPGNKTATSASSSPPLPLIDNAIKVDLKIHAQRISHMVGHPLLYRFVDWSSHYLFPKNRDMRSLYFWFIFYISHPQAVLCLLVGLLGLLLVYGQIALIDFTRTNYRPILAAILTDLSDTVLQLVNSIMSTASVTFANETNIALSSLETDLNTQVFGSIVQASGEINAALTNVQTTLIQGIQTVFGDTAFGKLVIVVLQCLLLNKLEVVETGLTWIQNNARITFPRVSDDVLMMSSTEMNNLVLSAVNDLAGPPSPANSTSTAASNSAAGGGYVEGAIGKVFEQYENEVRRGLPVYFGLIGVWWIVLAMGVCGSGTILVRHRNVVVSR
ncbi:hypothetical protein EDD21DRAFT_427943 [Dissophora ornata]|nr:hypothetical protein EDD21DRAFT_427943 [Dissophora ornata]